MGRRTIMSSTLLAAVTLAAGGCSTWHKASAGPDAVYVTVLQGRAGQPAIDPIEPEPRPFRLGAGDALGQMLYATFLAALRAGELDPDTRTVTAPDAFDEIVGRP